MARTLHLSITGIFFKLFQSLGVLIWKVNCNSSQDTPNIVLSKVSLFISVAIFTIIIYCMGKQLLRPVPFFETLYTTNIAVFIRVFMRLVTYAKLPAIFLSIWMKRTQIKIIYEKFLQVKDILKEINVTMSQEFIGAKVIYLILGWLSLGITVPVCFNFIGLKNPWPNISMVALFAILFPHIYGFISLMHFTILHAMVSKRLHQLSDVLISVGRN